MISMALHLAFCITGAKPVCFLHPVSLPAREGSGSLASCIFLVVVLAWAFPFIFINYLNWRLRPE